MLWSPADTFFQRRDTLVCGKRQGRVNAKVIKTFSLSRKPGDEWVSRCCLAELERAWKKYDWSLKTVVNVFKQHFIFFIAWKALFSWRAWLVLIALGRLHSCCQGDAIDNCQQNSSCCTALMAANLTPTIIICLEKAFVGFELFGTTNEKMAAI